ncbi:unnamed protein product [Danaus chrysippus]|uniref:(African queen) hypothetical protein n=1 Tax=Danaus chrysippus TaxID=151541 RepID=A0A8J2WBC2_9NEOP|nr:unnamed protein product [Danaus chrysippus]
MVLESAMRASGAAVSARRHHKGGTDNSGVTSGNPYRIYINEHLTRFNRLLFYKAREERKRHGLRSYGCGKEEYTCVVRLIRQYDVFEQKTIHVKFLAQHNFEID